MPNLDAMEAWNPMQEDYKQLGLGQGRMVNGRSSNEDSTKSVGLHVGNVPLDMSEDALRRQFLPYGKVLDIDKRKPNERFAQKNVTYAFISVESRRDADSIIEGLNHKAPYQFIVKMQHTPEERERLKQSRLANERQLFNGNMSGPSNFNQHSEAYGRLQENGLRSSRVSNSFAEIPRSDEADQHNHRLLPSCVTKDGRSPPHASNTALSTEKSIQNFRLRSNLACGSKDQNSVSKDDVPLGLGNDFISLKTNSYEEKKVNGRQFIEVGSSTSSSEKLRLDTAGGACSESRVEQDIPGSAGEMNYRLRVKESELTCVRCGLPSSTRCSVCKGRYCSSKCQLDDWYAHMQICRPPPPLEDCEDVFEPAASVYGNINGAMKNSHEIDEKRINDIFSKFPMEKQRKPSDKEKPMDEIDCAVSYRDLEINRNHVVEDITQIAKALKLTSVPIKISPEKSVVKNYDLNYEIDTKADQLRKMNNERNKQQAGVLTGSVSPVKIDKLNNSCVENVETKPEIVIPSAISVSPKFEFSDDVLSQFYKSGEELEFLVTSKIENNVLNFMAMVINDMSPIILSSTFGSFMDESKDVINISELKEGDIVGAKSANNDWCRVFVMQIISEIEVEVFLIDFGVLENVKDLKKLSQGYDVSTIPGLSLHITLFTKKQDEYLLKRLELILTESERLVFRIEATKSRSAKASLLDARGDKVAEYILRVWHHQFENRSITGPNSRSSPQSNKLEISRENLIKPMMSYNMAEPKRKVFFPTELPKAKITLGCNKMMPQCSEKGHLFVHLAVHGLAIAQDEMELELTKHCQASISLKSPEKGELVCAFYEEDEAWYRSEFIGIHEGRAIVKFIDYGNSGIVSLSAMRPFSNKLLNYQALAVDVLPVGLETMEKNKAESLLTKLIAKQELMLMEVTTLTPLTAIIMTSDKEPVIEHAVSKVPLINSSIYENKIAADVVKSESPESKKLETLQDSKKFVVDASKLSKNPMSGLIRYYDECIVLNLPINTQNFEVIVMHYKDCNNLYVMPCKDVEFLEAVDHLSGEMMNHCQSFQTLYYIPKEGEVVMARFSEDDQWYRGVCVDILQSREAAEIFFADYCNKEIVPYNRLCQMVSKFFEVPFLGIHCKIEGELTEPINPMQTIKLDIADKTDVFHVKISPKL